MQSPRSLEKLGLWQPQYKTVDNGTDLDFNSNTAKGAHLEPETGVVFFLE